MLISFLTIALYILLGIRTAQAFIKPVRTVEQMLKTESKRYNFDMI